MTLFTCERCDKVFGTKHDRPSIPRRVCEECRIIARAEATPDRFWAKVNKTNGCWPWTASCNSEGYGKFWNGKKLVLATRWLWESMHGQIPPRLLVCHTCDNPLCVRPDHLFLGTHQDNSQDSIAKGRFTYQIRARTAANAR
jgi:hypothetical protein